MSPRRKAGVALMVVGITGLLAGLVGLFQSSIEPPAEPAQMLRLGEERLRGGDLAGAAEWFGKAAKAAPDASAPRLATGKVRELSGDVEAAIEAYRDAADLAPDELGPRLALAKALARAGRRQEAEQELNAAHRRHPEAPEPLLLLGAIRLDAGRRAAAREAFETFAREHADDVRGPMRLAALYEADHETEAAREAYRRATAVSSDHAPAWEGVGRLAANAGDLDEAERAYRRVVELRPNDAGATTVLATILERRGRFADAERLFRRALSQLEDASGEARQTRALAWTGLGTTLLALDRRDEAYEALAAALTDDRDQPEALWALAPIYLDRGEPAEAARALERVVGQHGEEPLYWVLVGRAEAGQGRWLEARMDFQRALELDDDLFEARRWFGISLRALGVYRAAVLALEPVARERPDDGLVELNLAIARGQLGELEAAFEGFDRARALLPGDPAPDTYEAHLVLATDHAGEALERARAAVALDGDDPAALEVLARVLERRGEVAAARRAAARALEHATLPAHRRYLADLISRLTPPGDAGAGDADGESARGHPSIHP